MVATNTDDRRWKLTPFTWVSFFILGASLTFTFHDGLKELMRVWGEQEEYSYGYLIPLITIFLVWQKKDALERVSFSGSWWGVLIVLAGLGLFVIGKLSTFYHVMQYSFLIVLAGLVLAFMGRQGFRIIWVPLLLLLFMIPLPGFVLGKVSGQFQLLSSELGVWFIRLFGISVFLEGNVIDLGSMKLQVVEACSGLRYLFPLMTLAFIASYLFRAEFWKRVVLFLSSIPITILMNSFRIGAIGVLVEYWGKSMAEGFLHDFEGWAVFMACTGILIAEMWVLTRIGPNKQPLREMFSVDLPAATPKNVMMHPRPLSKSYLVAALIVVVAVAVSVALPQRAESFSPRKEFSSFPLDVGGWRGKSEQLEQMYIDALKLDDYILADFMDHNKQWVNLYAAYYASQNRGNASHSPRDCIPGGGWTINDLTQYMVNGVMVNGHTLTVNRAVIRKGDYKQLVYYWFQERERDVTDDTLVRWYIFWDSLTRNRSDGALVRMTTVVAPGEELAAADRRLTDFAKSFSEPLRGYIPN